MVDVASARTTGIDNPVTESMDDVSGRTEIPDSIPDTDGCARNPTSSSMSSGMETDSEEWVCNSESSNVPRFGNRRRADQPRTKDIRVIAVWRVAKLAKPVSLFVERRLDPVLEARPHL